MQFPSLERLELPCRFEQLLPGQPHPDGRRYLPLLLLGLPAAPPSTVTALAVVDRHHLVDPAHQGRAGTARLVFLLSTLRVQSPPFRRGLADPPAGAGGLSTAPLALGQVLAVPTWEVKRGELPYESLHVELLLDIGLGVVGVRTSVTAASLAESIGTPQIGPGDWLAVGRSRIDILGFMPA